ncbi:hypothetical protein OAQ99_04520 [Candidatus Kapabacteria bacterium]|nr:hypothetical protein [Candidatus Kapabacteria bacterium]
MKDKKEVNVCSDNVCLSSSNFNGTFLTIVGSALLIKGLTKLAKGK